MTVIDALSSFRELGKMSPHKRASVYRTDQLSDGLKLAGNGVVGSWTASHQFA